MEIHQILFSATTYKNGKKWSGDETKFTGGEGGGVVVCTYVTRHMWWPQAWKTVPFLAVLGKGDWY